MPQTFFNGATGDPVLTKARIAPQATEGVPADESAFSDYRCYGLGVPISPQLIQRLALPGSSISPLSPLKGKIGLGFSQSLGDVDPANKGLLNVWANLMRKYTYTDNTSWKRWFMSPGGATSAAAYLSLLGDNDLLPRFRLRDLVASRLRMAAAPDDNYAMEWDGVFSEFDFWGAVTQTVGAGSTKPILKGFYDGQLEADSVDKDLFLKIQTAATKKMRGKISAAASFGAIDDDYVLGAYSRVYNELTDPVDRLVGVIAEQAKTYWPVGATLADNDVFQIAKRRLAWSPTYGSSRAISSVNTIFFLNGTEIRVEGGWNVEVSAPGIQRRDDTSGRQSGRVRKAGMLDVRVSMTREAADLDLQIALLKQDSVAAVIEAKSDVEIGTSGRPYRALMIFPALRPEGSTFSVEAGGQNRDEELTLVGGLPDSAYVYDGISVSEVMAFVAENDVAAL